MKRFVLAAAVVAAMAVVAPAAASASGDPFPLCNGQSNCSTSWYTSPVTVTWSLNGGQNLGSGCSTQTYNGDTNQSNLTPLTPNLPSWTYCTNENATRYFFIKVELSSPTAAATPSRPPDSNGWYNHTVVGAMSAESFSRIASCTSTTYAGPNTTSATVSGTCVDNAGKSVTATSAPFAYDTTPPSLTASAGAGDRSVTVSWQTGGDIAPIASVNVERSPGPAGAAADAVYSGTSNSYVDTHVQNGAQYTYTITAVDAAGNSSVQTVVATPRAQVLAPTTKRGGSAAPPIVASPPILSWAPVRHASYYNLQLYRSGHKVLSIWPVHARLPLQQTWRFDGRRYRLKAGRYRWYVWPGFGKRRAASYGRMIGSGTFVIKG